MSGGVSEPPEGAPEGPPEGPCADALAIKAAEIRIAEYFIFMLILVI